jgi:F-type H+-transporting ATPase subunit gamma
VLVTTDRGLAGPLNTNTVRFAAREITEHPGDMAVVTVGRKGRDAMRRSRVPMEAHFAGFGDRPTFADVLPLARLLTDDYLSGDYNRIDVIYSRFISTLAQKPVMDQLLPIQPAEGHRRDPRQPVHLRAERRGGPGAARPALRRDPAVPRGLEGRRARNRAGWSR